MHLRASFHFCYHLTHAFLPQNNYKDYDFENRLSVRVNNALKKLKGASASSLQ